MGEVLDDNADIMCVCKWLSVLAGSLEFFHSFHLCS